MEAKLYIPTDLSEITLEQYQYLMKITNVKDEEEISARKMISVLCKIPLSAVLKLEVSSVLDITSKFSKMFEKYDQQLIHRFKLAGTEFGFIPHLESMSWGEYMDAEKYMSDWQSMHNAMSVLFRPIVKAKGDKYSIEEYESSINYAEVMKGMPLNVAISANVFFWTLGAELLEGTMNFLAEQMKEMNQEEKEIIAKELNLDKGGDGIQAYMQQQKEMSQSSMKLLNFPFIKL
tara:strand:- start:823 stop:1521 length:699 start_codon:yes stop_codon:yes gene_type:complete